MAHPLAISGFETAGELRTKIDGGDSYTVDAPAVARFVSRYLEGDLDAAQLAEIGDQLEAAEFVEYVGPGSDGIIAQVLFEMSTPESSATIDKTAAERWLRLLAS